MRRSLSTFLLSVGLFTVLGSFGFFLNDESETGAAAHNLYRGSLTVDEVPPEYYDNRVVDFTPRVVFLDGRGYVAESRGTAALGMLAYPALVVADAFGSAQLAFVFTAAAGLFGGAAVALEPWWRRRGWAARGWIAAGFVAALAAFVGINVATTRSVPLDPWGPPVATQLAMVVLSSAGVAAFHRFVHLRTGHAIHAHLAAAALALGTTLPFWAFGQKYHAAQVAFVAFVLLIRFVPHASWSRRAGAYVVAGVATWFHAKAGGLLLLSLLAVDGVTFLRTASRPERPLRIAALIGLAFVVGLVPYAVENTLLYGSPVAPGYSAIDVLAGSAGPADASPTDDGSALVSNGVRATDSLALATLVTTVKQVVRSSSLGHLESLPHALYASWVDPYPGRIQYGLLMLSPFLALAPLGVWRSLREDGADPLHGFLLVHAALAVLVYGVHSMQQGGGYEPRFYTILYPGLVLYATTYMRVRLGEGFERFTAAAAVAVPLALLLGVVALAAAYSDYAVHLLYTRDVGRAGLVLVVASVPITAAVDRWLPALARFTPHARAAAWTFGLVPPALVLVRTTLLHPREAWGGLGGDPLVMFLPSSDVLRVLLQSVML